MLKNKSKILQKLKKPLLRGYFHQEAFFVFLGACILLIAKASNKVSLLASFIYSLGVLILFGVSAVYHRIHWDEKARLLLKRLDHSAIYILIASTVTPICLLVMKEKDGFELLVIIWSAALLGLVQSVFWVKAPKVLSAILYVSMGWLVSLYLSELKQSVGESSSLLILGGGLMYSLGAVFYALKKPNPFPLVFGYHEIFHIFTIVGAVMHFVVIYQIIK